MKIKYVRFIIAAITTFGAFSVYVSRVNLSIAVIAMVENKNGTEEHKILPTKAQPTTIEQSPKPVESFPRRDSEIYGNNTARLKRTPTIILTPKKPDKTPMVFNWNQTFVVNKKKEQGYILGAFFYGYILFQIPGARIAESVGSKWIIMAASAGSAVISLLFPLSTQLNSIHLLMVMRFVMGLCQSAFFPAAYVLFCRWIPERERSILLPVMFIGSNIGSISTYILSSYLISCDYGWPSVFYLSGFVCLLVSILWWIFGSSSPEENWFITEEEREFIELNVNNQSSESNSLRELPIEGFDDELHEHRVESIKTLADNALCKVKPIAPTVRSKAVQPEPSWSKLLKSVPIWTLVFSMYGNEWSNVVLCFELPSYLNTALKIPIEQNGALNSFLQLSFALVSPAMSSLGNYILNSRLFGMHKIHVRKLFQSLATFGQLACFVSVPLCGANQSLIIMFMFSAIIFKACANAGDIMVPGDLSPEFAGTIFAFANSIGNTAGFFVPLLAGVLVSDPYDRVQWTPFWSTTAAIMGCSGVIFLVFGETRRQDFSPNLVNKLELHGANRNNQKLPIIDLKI